MGSGIAVVTGVAEGVSHQRKINEEASSETRQLKFHIDVTASLPCSTSPSARARSRSSSRVAAVTGSMVVLHGDRLWLEPMDPATRQPGRGHPFTGFYIPYPDEERGGVRGLVSTISRDPPMLNWVYVERETLRVKYSNRTGSIRHHVGPWDWTEESGPESCVTFDGWEGFVAVEEEGEEGEGKRWGLYFDLEDDGLKKQKGGRRSVEVSLFRRVISEQEVNKWGLGASGNLGVKKTEHSVKGKDMMEKDEDGG
ncbi:hypothetical protein BDZ85DRAFT_205976 [Elsinoe ampelina]|uniref:Uncharacterized protein n=1 Tax=Elsinoe ampelina TaxID=302913 RepID=A0A6A6G174_9PEZI|nr:hypothetical protein BDZ85DRAFT_205976 [Elsinoe ampelina]